MEASPAVEPVATPSLYETTSPQPPMRYVSLFLIFNSHFKLGISAVSHVEMGIALLKHVGKEKINAEISTCIASRKKKKAILYRPISSLLCTKFTAKIVCDLGRH